MSINLIRILIYHMLFLLYFILLILSIFLKNIQNTEHKKQKNSEFFSFVLRLYMKFTIQRNNIFFEAHFFIKCKT